MQPLRRDYIRVLFRIYVFTCVCILTSASDSKKKEKVVVAGLFSMPEGETGLGVKPAVNLALDMINRNKHILPGHQLEIIPNDTKCDMAVATKFFFDMVDSKHTVVMVFGDACSSVSGPIAEISKEWNLWLLSYADTNPVLSDRKKYSNFYRTVPSESDFNPARLALLRKFNWTNVGTIFQGVSKGTARYGHAHNHLVSLLEKANINVIKSVGFVNDPESAILELKKTDTRIIIGNFDVNMARHVFCQAYKKGMYGPKYQWIIIGGYPDEWWAAGGSNLPCSPDELNATIHGYIATDVLPLSSSRKRTESGLTPQKYLRKYYDRNSGHFSKYHAYAFDGVWVIAKAVDNILRKVADAETEGNATLTNGTIFSGDNISEALNETNFRGVTGHVKFHGGERIGSILFEQYQGEKMVKIAEYHMINDRLRFKNSEPILWLGKGPPIDRKLIRVEYQRVPRSVYIAICSLAGLGLCMSTLFLALNITFREHRYIKMSSPNLNNVIIIGCFLTYCSVVLLGTDGGVVQPGYLGYICISRAWVLALGFTLAFGAMFSKTWRVHSIFTDIALHKKAIKDYKLLLVVTVLLVIDAGILVTWQVLDPLHLAIKNLTTRVEGDLDIVPVVEFCSSNKITTWLGILYVYKGLLLVFGVFLAWETRQVTIPALNDSKYIGMSVYNVVIMCICGAAVSFVINDQPTSSFVIISFFIIFCTTITLCLVFVPKIVEIKRDPTGEERRVRAKLQKPKKQLKLEIKRDPTGEERRIRAKLQKPKKQFSSDMMCEDLHKRNKELQEENIRCRNIIAEKMRVLHNLMEQLGEENIGDKIHYAGKSPVHKKVTEIRLAESSPSRMSSASEDEACSILSDMSYGSPMLTIRTNPANRIHFRTTKSTASTCTETSIADSDEDLGRRILSNLEKLNSHYYCQDEEEDCDPFGGIYCGPPSMSSLNNGCQENGRAKLISEIHPLVNDISGKSYNATSHELHNYLDPPVLENCKLPSTQRKCPGAYLRKTVLLANCQHMKKTASVFPDRKLPAGKVGAGKCGVSSLQVAGATMHQNTRQRGADKTERRTKDKANVKNETSNTDAVDSLGFKCDIIEYI